jgi:hypothetical protein
MHLNHLNLSVCISLLAVSFSIGGVAASEAKSPEIPPRDPKARPELIDLSAHYNAALTDSWHPASNMAGETGNDLSELPRGVQKLDGIEFDLRGLIQVSGSGDQNSRGPFPEAAKGIKVGLRCARLHFLHGTGFVDREGQKIGSYTVHYADGQTNEIPIVYGEDVRDWWAYTGLARETKRATVAWTGKNKATQANGLGLQLFCRPWDNPRPDVLIESVDFSACKARSIPFLIAITAESPRKP